MRKKYFAVLVIISIMLSSIPCTVKADEDSSVNYSEKEMEYIVDEYYSISNWLNLNFCNSEKIAYWTLSNNLQDNSILRWLLNTSSACIGQKPDKKKCVEILTNIMTMQEYELANQIEEQKKFDDLKDGYDYAWDVIDIATSYFGVSGSETAKDVLSIIETASDGISMLEDDILKQAKYYQASIQDYSRMDYFLDSIEEYAEIPELKDAAVELRNINKTLLLKRLEYIGDTAGSMGEYEAHVLYTY